MDIKVGDEIAVLIVSGLAGLFFGLWQNSLQAGVFMFFLPTVVIIILNWGN